MDAFSAKLDNLEKSWSALDNRLNFWTALVVIGVAVEAIVLIVEYRHEWKDFKRGTIHTPDRPSLWPFLVGFIAIALVVIGVSGELRLHIEAGRIETDIRDTTRQLVSLAEGDAIRANERAASAMKSAVEANAGTLREIDARLALEKDVLWRGPRDVLIRSTGNLISNSVRRFHGQRFKASICWPENGSSERTPFPAANNELLLTEQAIRIQLSKGGWTVIQSPNQSLPWIDLLPILIPNSCSGPGIWVATRKDAPRETRRAAAALQLAINKAVRQILPFGGSPAWGIDAAGSGFPSEGVEVHIGTHPILPGNPEFTVPSQR